MKVNELINELKQQNLDFEVSRNQKQIALYYHSVGKYKKFLEIHSNNVNEVTYVKFHSQTLISSSMKSSVTSSGDDDCSITKKIVFDNNYKDILDISIDSYNKVKDLYDLKLLKKSN